MSEGSSSSKEEPKLILRSVPDRVKTSGSDEIKILTTRGGKPSDEVVKLRASAGKFTSGGKFREGWAVTGANGRATVLYNAPSSSQVDGAEKVRMEAQIMASAVGSDSATETTVVQEPIDVRVDLETYDLKPGDSTEVTFRATRGEAPVPGVPLDVVLNPRNRPEWWEEGSGSIADDTVKTGADGTASTTYRAPEEPTQDAIDVRGINDDQFINGLAKGVSVKLEDDVHTDVFYHFPDPPPNPGDTIDVILEVTNQDAPVPSVPLDLEIREPAGGDHRHDDSPRGELSESRVVTDSNGKAAVRYHAPDEPTTSALMVRASQPEILGYCAIEVRKNHDRVV